MQDVKKQEDQEELEHRRPHTLSLGYLPADSIKRSEPLLINGSFLFYLAKGGLGVYRITGFRQQLAKVQVPMAGTQKSALGDTQVVKGRITATLGGSSIAG